MFVLVKHTCKLNSNIAICYNDCNYIVHSNNDDNNMNNANNITILTLSLYKCKYILYVYQQEWNMMEYVCVNTT